MVDSTFVKRAQPKKRGVLEVYVKPMVKDAEIGFSELRRQMGTAVQNVKSGIEKIKQSMR